MSGPVSPDLDVAVVGAGIAGVSLAHRLRRAGLEVRVFEASDRVGGRMATLRRDGYTVDEGAEQLPTTGYEATWELLRELDVPPAELPTVGGGVGVWRHGRAHAGIAHPRGLLTGAGLSGLARLDLLRFTVATQLRRRSFDPDHPERTPLAAATVRQLGQRYHPDLGRYLFEPVVAGFFGWDPRRSAAAPFVSLMLAVGPSSGWRTYRGGMDTLARRLAERLDVDTSCPVREVVATGAGVRVTTDGGVVTARSAVLCVPAPVALDLHPAAPEPERRFLADCGFTPMLKVSCLLDRPLSPDRARRLGILLVPRERGELLAGLTMDHVRHPDRAPAGCGLVGLVAAPWAIPELADLPDDEVAHWLTAAGQRFLPGLATAIRATVVHRFTHGLPEATPAAMASRPAFLHRPLGPVDYAGDWVMLRPSSEGAVRAARLTAARVLAWHRRPASATPHRRHPA